MDLPLSFFVSHFFLQVAPSVDLHAIMAFFCQPCRYKILWGSSHEIISHSLWIQIHETDKEKHPADSWPVSVRAQMGWLPIGPVMDFFSFLHLNIFKQAVGPGVLR